MLVTTAYKRNEGRLFGGQFLDGVSSAVDAVSMIRYDYNKTQHAGLHVNNIIMLVGNTCAIPILLCTCVVQYGRALLAFLLECNALTTCIIFCNSNCMGK